MTPVTASEAESGHATRAVDTEAPPEVAAEAGQVLSLHLSDNTGLPAPALSQKFVSISAKR